MAYLGQYFTPINNTLEKDRSPKRILIFFEKEKGN
tara:strand:+ start:34870 stop:34974 length:105 start_codon:yes stop_codon:yes gene_type:complete